MTNYIFSETRENNGAIVHIITWTLGETIGKDKLSHMVYNNLSYGPNDAVQDVAKRLGVSVGAMTYGLNGRALARIVETTK